MKVLACIVGAIALLAFRPALHDGFRKVFTAAATDHAAACLSMAGSTTREEEGRTFIVGSIRNNCDRKFDHVTIAFKLSRDSGSRFDSDAPILAYSHDLQPGETRNFKSPYSIGRNSTYRFDRITAY